jgi:hypothetical protein
MIRDPRTVVDQLFGGGGTAAQRAARRLTEKSILDWITGEVAKIKNGLGPVDRGPLDQYHGRLRAVRRRNQNIEEHNAKSDPDDLPRTPVGIPDSFEEHIQIMFDLQALAFASGITRVASFKLSRDATGRAFPESGVKTAFHTTSHHGEDERKITDFAKINDYHVAQTAYFIEKLKGIPDVDGTLLDNSVVLYGSPMGNSNVHNHKRCPLFLAGHAGGQIKGNSHVITPDGTPMANVFVSLLRKMGHTDLERFGDSDGEVAF